MTVSKRRHRLMLATSVVALAVAPWMVTAHPEAAAQVDTTSTTEPPTTTLPPPPPPTTTTTRRTTTTTRRTTTTPPATTTTTVPPTTTVATTTTAVSVRTTTTRQPPRSTTTLIVTTTTGFVPPSPDPGTGGTGGTDGTGGLPPWSLPFVGAGAMLGAIVLATGVIRLATRGVPAFGRSMESLAYKSSSFWTRLTTRHAAPPSNFTAATPTLGARIGGFFLALSSPFRRLAGRVTGRDFAAGRLRSHSRTTGGGLWDRIVLRMRMTRARFGQTRSSVDGQKRYWWLRFRRYLPWLR